MDGSSEWDELWRDYTCALEEQKEVLSSALHPLGGDRDSSPPQQQQALETLRDTLRRVRSETKAIRSAIITPNIEEYEVVDLPSSPPLLSKKITSFNLRDNLLKDQTWRNIPEVEEGADEVDTEELHEELVQKLQDRGADEALMEEAREVKKVNIGLVVQDLPEKVCDHIEAENNSGIFIRKTICRYKLKRGLRTYNLVFWQHFYSDGTKAVEYLMDLKIKTSRDGKTHIVKLESVDEKDLSGKVRREFLKLKTNNSIKKAKRAKIKGELVIGGYEYGQAAVTFHGDLEAGEDQEWNIQEEPTPTPSKKSGVRNRIKRVVTTRLRTQASSISITKNSGKVESAVIFTSVKGILFDCIGSHFRQTSVIDMRRQEKFVKESMPNAPPLTNVEKAMFEKVENLEKTFREKGKRIYGTINEHIDKFQWMDGDDNVWAAFSVVVHNSAAQTFAFMFTIDSYERKENFEKDYSGLPRKIIHNIDNSRSISYRTSMHLPSPYGDRVFDQWLGWKEVKSSSTGKISYLIGFVPIDDYPGTGLDEEIDTSKLVLAETTGIIIITKIAPNICRVSRIQNVDFKVNLPTTVVNIITKVEMRIANRLHQRYKRNAKIVDAEVREALVKKMKEGIELEDDQKEVFADLEALFKGDMGEGNDKLDGYKPLDSPFHNVKMKAKYVQQLKKMDKSVMVGYAEGIADCTAEEAAAWAFEFCSENRNQSNLKHRNFVRSEIRMRTEDRVNEKLFALVKRTPFPLAKREVVFKQIWNRNEDESMSVAVYPVFDKVDYGGNMGRMVQAKSYGLLSAKNIERIGDVPQSEIKFFYHADAGGYVPTSQLNKHLPQLLGFINDISLEFDRGAEVDKVKRSAYATIVREKAQVYSADEEKALARGKELYMRWKFKSQKFTEIDIGDAGVSYKFTQMEGDKLISGLCEFIIDAPLEDILSFCYIKELRAKRDADMVNSKIGERYIKKINDHSQYYLNNRILGFGLGSREWRQHCIWKKEGDKIWLVYDDTDMLDNDPDLPPKAGGTRASLKSTWKMETLAVVGGVPQTRVSIVSRVKLGGLVATTPFILRKIQVNYANSFISLRKFFDKSREIDKFNRTAIVARLSEFNKLSGDTFEENFKDEEGMQKVEGAFHVAETYVKVLGKGKGWGKTTFKMRSSLEEAVAFFWVFDSRASYKTTGDTERTILKDYPKTWNRIVSRRQKADCLRKEYCYDMQLHKTSESSTFVITMDAVTNDDHRMQSKFMNSGTAFKAYRVDENVKIRLTKKEDSLIKVEVVIQLSLGDKESMDATRYALERHLDEIADAERYFTNEVPLCLMTKQDGEVLGADLVWDGGKLGGNHSRQEREKHIDEVCEESLALREVAKKYPWFVTMLKRARLGNFAFNSSQSEKLECVENGVAKVLGNNLMPCLKSRKVIAAGVDTWRLQNRAIGELFVEFPWMEDMFVELGKGVVKMAPWGLLFRVGTGSIASVLDLATDIYVAIMYYNANRMGYFNATVAMLLLSFALQLATVLAQHRSSPYKKLIQEIMWVLSGLKSAIDAKRVASGDKGSKTNTFDLQTELIFTKVIEVFAESISGIIIQVLAISTTKKDEEIQPAAWVSLAISAISTGFIGATISYDYDTDPERRDRTPTFYGYVPSNPRKRSIVFGSLVLFGAGILLIRCSIITMLAVVAKRWAFLYIGADLFLFMVIKILRGDVWYWLPLGRNMEVLASFICRVIIKVVTDFTSIAQFRHPGEVGGLQWSLGLVQTMASFPLVVQLYVSHIVSQEGVNPDPDAAMDRNITYAWGAVKIFIPSVFIFFSIFLLNIEHSYWNTFWSTQTGKDLTVQNFREGTSDAAKMGTIFNVSKKNWEAIEEDVKDFVEVNWRRWEEEKPKWFTEGMIREKIPVSYIPNAEERKRETVRRITHIKKKKKGNNNLKRIGIGG